MNTPKMGMREPCPDCPFLSRFERGFTIDRLLSMIGEGIFPCHKTCVTNDEGDFKAGPDSMACAGALIFQLKAERPNQLTRIMLRIGSLKGEDLNLDAPVREWDSDEEETDEWPDEDDGPFWASDREDG